jgi:hypothetical protein
MSRLSLLLLGSSPPVIYKVLSPIRRSAPFRLLTWLIVFFLSNNRLAGHIISPETMFLWRSGTHIFEGNSFQILETKSKWYNSKFSPTTKRCLPVVAANGL